MFQNTYLFTINSGAGSGTYIPCVGASTDGGGASVAFGNAGGASAGGRRGNDGTCGFGSNPGTPTSFVDGVTQTLLVTLSTSGGSTANTALDQVSTLGIIQTPHFFDSNSNPLSNVSFTLVAIDAPEPPLGLLVALSAGVPALLSLKANKLLDHSYNRRPRADRVATKGPMSQIAISSSKSSNRHQHPWHQHAKG